MTNAPSRLWEWQYAASPTQPYEYEPVSFKDIPGWEQDDHGAALVCFLKSVSRLGFDQFFSDENHQEAVRAKTFFESSFRPVKVIKNRALLTSYFEPVLNGSRTRSNRFHVPVYKRPPDLVALAFDHPLREHGLTAGRPQTEGYSIEPYYTRREIADGALEGQTLELLYLDDAIAAYVMHVQGSGAIQLEDGSFVRLSFDGKNGHPYTSIGRVLIENGVLTPETANLEAVLSWLRNADQKTQGDLLACNTSYIFFKELSHDAQGPTGSLGVPLTAGRSLAVDARVHTLGMPIFVDAPQLLYEQKPFQKLMIAQDTGSAIVGPHRGDIFAGIGEAAGHFAGHVRHNCQFYAFILK